MTYRRKLIEVALPLEAINTESALEKSPRPGNPSTLHLWWARRPLAACRAVLFASLVDDPSEYCSNEEAASVERERIFKIIEDLVKWENINNDQMLDMAKLEIARSVARDLGVDVPVGKQAVREFLANQAPPILDPFAGGGSIPLEAQRLGLRAYASDLNPVAVLINKALVEIPPKFANMPPIHSLEEVQGTYRKGSNIDKQTRLWKKEWKGAEGLSEDVRYYGKWMRDEAYKRIGHLYPSVKITTEMLSEHADFKTQGLKAGDELTVIAWLWARTVKCPNPACGAQMPLMNSFSVCTKPNKPVFVQPIITDKIITFKIVRDKHKIPAPPKVGHGIQFNCLVCGQMAKEDYIKAVGLSDHSQAQLVCIVADGPRGRVYFSPDKFHEEMARNIVPDWQPNLELSHHPQYMAPPRYKMDTFADLYTARQLTALSVLSDLVQETYSVILEDAQKAFSSDLRSNYIEYAQAVSVYLGLNVSRQANRLSTLCFWDPGGEKIQQVFSRQAYTMNWNFPETNPFSNSSGNFIGQLGYIRAVLENLPKFTTNGFVEQKDAAISRFQDNLVVSTDPPYYDNVPYADLSDYFYVWLRKALSRIYPQLFTTLLVPKADELVADHQRHGSKEAANLFFEKGLLKIFGNFRQSINAQYPLTVYYAYKQTESTEYGDEDLLNTTSVSTGWETMLEGLINSGFSINATWPMRTEQTSNIKKYKNTLASSIVLVCRARSNHAEVTIQREFQAHLKRELPHALRQLQQGSIAPVDLAQAAIGPGMAVFSRYKQVLEADGSPMRVRTALALINQALDEFLTEQEGEFDSDTRWALAWYEQYGHEQGQYGIAETLSKAKNTSVEGLVEAGFLGARAGKVRLLRRDELDPEWNPQRDKRPTAWEACQHLIYDLDKSGEQAAAALLVKLGSLSETARDLAYRLYTVCERKGWAQDALGYNMLVVAWPRIKEQARNQSRQEKLF